MSAAERRTRGFDAEAYMDAAAAAIGLSIPPESRAAVAANLARLAALADDVLHPPPHAGAGDGEDRS
jgi:hypothetical protein